MDVPACVQLPQSDVRARRFCSGAHPCDHPVLSVVIVNYWRWEDTARLIKQLRDGQILRSNQAEVVVVDNHSPMNPLVPRLRRAAGVSLRRWKRNQGFARAVNEGCRLSRGDWLLLLNPDTMVPPGFLDLVHDRLKSLPARAGIVGFQLHDPDGSVQPSTGRFPDLFSTLSRLLLPRRNRKYTAPSSPGPSEVDWVTGCGLLIRRECLTDLNGLDPDFFLYYEDVDLCRRARENGWSVWFDPSARLVHLHPLHSRSVPPYLRLITRHALLTYANKHWPTWQVRLLASLIRTEAQFRRLLAWTQGNHHAGEIFGELQTLVCELQRGDVTEAYGRLMRVVRTEEEHRAGNLEHYHSLAQSSGSVATVFEECPSKRP